MLTRKQHDLLLYIHKCILQDGVSPSFDEMKDALNLKSKSGIHRLITALEERGFIRRLAHRARALEIIKLPESAIPANPAIFPTGVTHGGQPTPIASNSDGYTIPMVGKIAAGMPIAALENPISEIQIPMDLVGKGKHYALEIQGDSMIDAGILDGDTAIIEHVQTAQTGDIVVAIIREDEEATLKRLRKKGDTIALEPANSHYETKIFGADRVEIRGRLAAILRRY